MSGYPQTLKNLERKSWKTVFLGSLILYANAIQRGAKSCKAGRGRPARHSGFIVRVSCSLHGCACSDYWDPNWECTRWFEFSQLRACVVLGLCQKPVVGPRVLDDEKNRQMMTLRCASETDRFGMLPSNCLWVDSGKSTYEHPIRAKAPFRTETALPLDDVGMSLAT
jgi:hypothetical protein